MASRGDAPEQKRRSTDGSQDEQQVNMLDDEQTEEEEEDDSVEQDVIQEVLYGSEAENYTDEHQGALLRRPWEATIQCQVTEILRKTRKVAKMELGFEDNPILVDSDPKVIAREDQSQAANSNRLVEGGSTKHNDDSMSTVQGKLPTEAELCKTNTYEGAYESIDEYLHQVMDDSPASFEEGSRDSLSYQCGIDLSTWLNAATNSGKDKVMDDYPTSFEERNRDSLSYQDDINYDAWLKAATNSGKGKVMDDYPASSEERNRDSLSYQDDINYDAWLKAATNSGEGKVMDDYPASFEEENRDSFSYQDAINLATWLKAETNSGKGKVMDEYTAIFEEGNRDSLSYQGGVDLSPWLKAKNKSGKGKVMDDHTTSFEEGNRGSLSYLGGIDIDAWLKGATNSIKGQLYRQTPDNARSNFSKTTHGLRIYDSPKVQSQTRLSQQQMSKVEQGVEIMLRYALKSFSDRLTPQITKQVHDSLRGKAPVTPKDDEDESEDEDD